MNWKVRKVIFLAQLVATIGLFKSKVLENDRELSGMEMGTGSPHAQQSMTERITG